MCIFSVAILKYLATVYKVADHWYPQDVKRRAKVDEYMAWQHANIRMNGSMYFLYFVSIIDSYHMSH